MNALDHLAYVLIPLLSITHTSLPDEVIDTSTFVQEGKRYTFTLYRFERDADWDAAYNACLAENQNLARIENERMQINLIYRNISHGESHVWLGGQRSTNDVTWKYVSGKPADDITGGPDAFCGAMRIDNITVLAPQGWQCDITEFPALCQYEMEDACSGDHAPAETTDGRQYCYFLQDVGMTTWLKARRQCQNAQIGADLAWSSFEDTPIQNLLLEYVQQAVTPQRYVWVGLHRQPWYWMAGDPPSDGTEVQYENWGGGQGNSANQEFCMYLDLNLNNTWGDKTCADRAPYYLCQTGLSVTSTSTEYSTTTVSVSTVKQTPSTGSTAETEMSTTQRTSRSSSVTSNMLSSTTDTGDNASTVTTTVPTPTEFTGTATNDSILPSEADIGHLSTEWPGNAPSGHMEATDWTDVYIIAGVLGSVLLILAVFVPVGVVVRQNRRRRNKTRPPSSLPEYYATNALPGYAASVTSADDAETYSSHIESVQDVLRDRAKPLHYRGDDDSYSEIGQQSHGQHHNHQHHNTPQPANPGSDNFLGIWQMQDTQRGQPVGQGGGGPSHVIGPRGDTYAVAGTTLDRRPRNEHVYQNL